MYSDGASRLGEPRQKAAERRTGKRCAPPPTVSLHLDGSGPSKDHGGSLEPSIPVPQKKARAQPSYNLILSRTLHTPVPKGKMGSERERKTQAVEPFRCARLGTQQKRDTKTQDGMPPSVTPLLSSSQWNLWRLHPTTPFLFLHARLSPSPFSYHFQQLLCPVIGAILISSGRPGLHSYATLSSVKPEQISPPS